jgi:hypothetical protein
MVIIILISILIGLELGFRLYNFKEQLIHINKFAPEFNQGYKYDFLFVQMYTES